MNKKILLFLLVCALLYLCVQLFNHVDPWFGIGGIILLIIGLLNYFKTKIKKTEE